MALSMERNHSNAVSIRTQFGTKHFLWTANELCPVQQNFSAWWQMDKGDTVSQYDQLVKNISFNESLYLSTIKTHNLCLVFEIHKIFYDVSIYHISAFKQKESDFEEKHCTEPINNKKEKSS